VDYKQLVRDRIYSMAFEALLQIIFFCLLDCHTKIAPQNDPSIYGQPGQQV
jgi:hypothetical protein